MVIIDTNIIIDHLRQRDKKDTDYMILARDSKSELAISVITLQELYSGSSTKKEEAEKLLLASIAPLKILPYTYEVSQFAGEIMRDSEKPIEFADAAIAATTIVYGGQLLTLDKKDFSHIKDLRIRE
ncbi:hypothetical protein A2W14_06565 [Candidatus Gottesmanbacteria bacterium RBG_16_37_8]|uniref:Ribonuclease VapC n=1 Tax=Candidatus Gottesmanbacteria bacterium RBG_16_37_8 TaxID=1798371 RepID=A0A1F5YQ02_9BACT|nr:MAG: hypothetical protein A2W14_06565 [Candidatus Gottesmanbacteria bacterium RBG_16_37_8]